MPFNKLKHQRVLLIDDDEFVQDSLSLMFESRGCFLRVVDTAEEAIGILQVLKYDVFLVDYKLPGMDGLDLCRYIKKLCPDALKIMITAYSSKAVREEAEGIGVDEILEKPITSEAIEKSLLKLFSKPGHEPQS